MRGTIVKNSQPDQHDSDLPKELAQPARRALAGAGYSRLDQLTTISEDEISKLHGIGPNAIRQLRRALNAQGLSFAEGK
jgi:hypothetical protein